MSQHNFTLAFKNHVKAKKQMIENDTKTNYYSNKENVSNSANIPFSNKENNKILGNTMAEGKHINDIASLKQYTNSASRNPESIYSGYFGSKLEDNKTLNNITVEPFQENTNENNTNVIKDLMNEDSVYAFESFLAPIKKTKIDNSTTISHSKTPSQKSFFDLMKNINFSTFNQSNTNMFVAKPKKKIMTTEELLLEKINREKEVINILKQKNQISIEKIKNYTPKAMIPTPLTTFQPFNITSNLNMLKKKRINNNTEELNEKIKEQMKKKFGENSKFLKDKLFEENNKKYTEEHEIDAEIQDISSGMESVSLSKSRNKDSSVNGLIKFKLPTNISNNLGSKLTFNKSSSNLLKSDKSSSHINSVITKTREEKDRIEKETKEMNKKTLVMEKKYYYKGKAISSSTKKPCNA